MALDQSGIRDDFVRASSKITVRRGGASQWVGEERQGLPALAPGGGCVSVRQGRAQGI
jgi:hypothetical protein